MTLKSLEEFDRENEAKRARLIKDHKLAHALPTSGKVVTWTGEGGWEADGNTRKPDVQRSIELVPRIVHSPFRGAEHVNFRAPDSLTGESGEHVSSPHRAEFVRRYFKAVLDACEPHMIATLAVKGHYASLVPETFDYAHCKEYADATELARGIYEVEVSAGREYSHAKLAFYINTEATGPTKVSFDVDSTGFSPWKLIPRAIRRNDQYESSNIVRWDVPQNTGACHVFRRGGADMRGGVPQSYTLEWLFDTREAMEAMILPKIPE